MHENFIYYMGNGPHQKHPMKSGVYCLEMVATYPLVLSPCRHSHNKKKKKRGMSPPVLEVFYFPGLCYQHFVLVHYNHMSICRNAKILMRIHRVPWKEWLVLIQNKNNVVAGVISWWWLNMWPSCMPKEEHGKYMAQFQLELLT